MTDLQVLVLILSVCAFIGLCIYRVEVGYWPWDDVAKAIRTRNAKRDAYRREYLSYGFDAAASLQKANARMEKEATEAEAL